MEDRVHQGLRCSYGSCACCKEKEGDCSPSGITVGEGVLREEGVLQDGAERRNADAGVVTNGNRGNPEVVTDVGQQRDDGAERNTELVTNGRRSGLVTHVSGWKGSVTDGRNMVGDLVTNERNTVGDLVTAVSGWRLVTNGGRTRLVTGVSRRRESVTDGRNTVGNLVTNGGNMVGDLVTDVIGQKEDGAKHNDKELVTNGRERNKGGVTDVSR
jgi:hypothetical protein